MTIALLLVHDKLSWQSAHLPKTQKANTASNNRSWPTCLVPSAHATPRYFLGLHKTYGTKVFSVLKADLFNSGQEYNWAEFQKPSLLFRRKTNDCRNFYLYCFCALLCRRQRFNPSLYRLTPLIICLSRVWFCLFFSLVVCLFVFVFFFIHPSLHFFNKMKNCST